jgi:hypothetical protein
MIRLAENSLFFRHRQAFLYNERKERKYFLTHSHLYASDGKMNNENYPPTKKKETK